MEPTDRRPDVDIEEEIAQLIRSFSPLKQSRTFFTYHSVNGFVTITGNVRNPQSRRVLVDNVPRIVGVTGADSSNLYDDEMIRFAVGHILPPGIYASVQYGSVALTGRLPANVSAEAITDAVAAIPGVRRVGAEFSTREESESTPN